ncbi:hypothetical protein [Moorena sp. SIO3H5]|uniref:hypothetical protein n=1 Tax=Moorena sp. SIO3H5 TaxID=2607834 RepID=UPI0013B80463|nr:hypothetical protein [Moorena sp. SIO3H5]NEO73393.1 hypothetical protein [Moorena sp. SIO3H5]
MRRCDKARGSQLLGRRSANAKGRRTKRVDRIFLLLPVACCLLPVADSRFPIPDSQIRCYVKSTTCIPHLFEKYYSKAR